MNIFYLDWNSFCNEDLFDVLTELGHNIIKVPYKEKVLQPEMVKERLEKELKNSICDFIFSFNYFPEVSNCCKELELKYVAWVYDSPHIQVYSYTVLNPCNYIFLFDYAMYEEFQKAGIETVYYMPLAVNEKKLAAWDVKCENGNKYIYDVSFVGSLYTEKRHRIYDRFQNIDEYSKGYLDGLIQAQKHVYGYNFLQEMLTAEIVTEMQKAYPTNPNTTTVLSPEAIYADYVLSRQVTALERQEILELLGKQHEVQLFTHDAQMKIPGVNNRGPIDYYDEMPYVFRKSKINLNITLRSIKTGIPLRAMDIMGNGGFLITNYQEELLEYFVPDKEFVYYTSYEELCEKVDYYLKHEEERKEIAKNGCERVRMQHTFKQRLEQIFAIVLEEKNENTSL